MTARDVVSEVFSDVLRSNAGRFPERPTDAAIPATRGVNLEYAPKVIGYGHCFTFRSA
jgi:hypothetical protein